MLCFVVSQGTSESEMLLAMTQVAVARRSIDMLGPSVVIRKCPSLLTH